MKFEDFVTKRKEYDEALEGEEFETYYEGNSEFCLLMGLVCNIEETLDEELASIISPNDFEIELDEIATTQVLKTLRQLKERKIEEF